MLKTSSPPPQRATFRSAEDLYTQLPVRDVVRVLAKTKEDAEKKREELRDLVGRRYHDLIDSADAIINMNDTVAEFERCLLTIESSASLLLGDMSKIDGSKSSKREKVKTSSSVPSPRALTEKDQIDLILKAPTEIWNALDQGNELKAATCFLKAEEVAKQLNLLPEQGSTTAQLDEAVILEIKEASMELSLNDSLFEKCKYFAQRAIEDRKRCGDKWQLHFPFLISQAQLVLECRKDIVKTCNFAFSEKHISASHVEKAMEALLVLKEVSNPAIALLDARAKAMDQYSGDIESTVINIAELSARTVRDCTWLKKRFPQFLADVDYLNNWIETIAKPAAKRYTDQLCSKINTISALASVQRTIKDAITKTESDEDGSLEVSAYYKILFGTSFQERSAYLLQSSHEMILKRVKKLLSNSIEIQKNLAGTKAFDVLEKGLTAIKRDSQELGENHQNSTWLADLTFWLEQRPTPVVARFCESLIGYLQDGEHKDIKERLRALNEKALKLWVTSLVKRRGDILDVQAIELPWSKDGRKGSSAVGGWTSDPVHGELPSTASWPIEEYCFSIARELDLFTESISESKVHLESDLKVRKMVGDLAWKHAHATLSNFAKESHGADGKLQAAFDLEYSAAALIGSDARVPLPFTNGGVDVYACADVLRTRAKAFAASSRLLHSALGSTIASKEIHETRVGGHQLLTLIEPIPRFALLPVPQKRAQSPRLLRNNSSNIDLGTPIEKVNSKSSVSIGSAGGLGRVLGWLT